MIYLFYYVLSLLYFLPCSTPAKVEVASAIQQPISSSSSSLPASISPSRSACNSSSLPPLFPSDLQFAKRAWNNNRMRKNSWQGRGCQGHLHIYIVPPDLHHVTMDHNNAAADSVLLLFFSSVKTNRESLLMNDWERPYDPPCITAIIRYLSFVTWRRLSMPPFVTIENGISCDNRDKNSKRGECKHDTYRCNDIWKITWLSLIFRF